MAINDLVISYPDFKLLTVIDPEQFDTNNADVKQKMNEVIALVNVLTDNVADGNSGADKISLTSVAPFTSTKLQEFLEQVIARLQAVTDGASGADLIGSTTITGVTGSTVQEQLESFKYLHDVLAGRTTTLETKVALKTDNNGDHKGTWQGYTPLQVAEGINSQRIDALEAEVVTGSLHIQKSTGVSLTFSNTYVANRTITFPTPFKDTAYFATASPRDSVGGLGIYLIKAEKLSATQVQFTFSTNGQNNVSGSTMFDWFACGLI